MVEDEVMDDGALIGLATVNRAPGKQEKKRHEPVKNRNDGARIPPGDPNTETEASDFSLILMLICGRHIISMEWTRRM